MSQTEDIVQALKRILRSHQISYAQVAAYLELSEASVKRMFSRSSFTLERLESIAELANVRVADLTRLAEEQRQPLSQLTPEQEQQLVRDPKLLLVTYLALNGWTLEGVVKRFDITEPEVVARLAQLDRLGIIELLPANRIRRLVARNFSWRPEGPVQAYFEQAVRANFFADKFSSDASHLRFVGGLMSDASIKKMHRAIERIVHEFDELMQQDSLLELEQKHSVGAVFAIRPWELPAFVDLKRDPNT